MKLKIAVLLLLTASCTNTEGNKSTTNLAADSDLRCVQQWFDAWTLLSEEVLLLPDQDSVEFVFFDDSLVYSTSRITVESGTKAQLPQLLGNKQDWQVQPHHGKITLPDGQTVPVGMLIFAAPIAEREGWSYFVMPLEKFWEKAGVSNEVLSLRDLTTGVFVHEFSHSQQMKNFGQQLTVLQSQTTLKGNYDDNIVQTCFANDSDYVRLFRLETNTFYVALQEQNDSAFLEKVKKGLRLYHKRQEVYFTGEFEELKAADDIFLTMEGAGQFNMYAWLTQPKGGKYTDIDARIGVRNGGKVWSQDEGLALFLVLSRLSPAANWAKMLYASKAISIIQLIEKEID
jgi:hypothetical protein